MIKKENSKDHAFENKLLHNIIHHFGVADAILEVAQTRMLTVKLLLNW